MHIENVDFIRNSLSGFLPVRRTLHPAGGQVNVLAVIPQGFLDDPAKRLLGSDLL
jgi:hypothetical protein